MYVHYLFLELRASTQDWSKWLAYIILNTLDCSIVVNENIPGLKCQLKASKKSFEQFWVSKLS